MENIKALAEQRVLERALGKRDKMYLANEIMGYDFQECHRELFALYPDFDENKSWAEQIQGWEDIMVLWPRGHYKSTAIKVVVVQAILNNPNLTILCMQGNVSLTKIFVEEIAKHFRGEFAGSRFAEVYPEFCTKRDDNGELMIVRKALKMTQMGFTVPNRTSDQPQATIAVASPRSMKTGQHYMLGVFDDLQNESNWRNPKQILKVQEDFQGCQPLVQGGARWVSGTRWTFGDLYEQIIRWDTKQKWVISVKDCWSDDKTDVRFPRFKKKNGEPAGFTRDDLLALQEQDRGFFACQYECKPIHTTQAALTQEDLNKSLINFEELPPLSKPIFQIDLASSEAIKADDSVITVGKIDTQGTGYLVDMDGGQWNPTELAMRIIQMALKHRPTRIVFEKSSSCVYFVEFLRMMAKRMNVYLPLEMEKIDVKFDAKNTRVLAWAGTVKRKAFKIVRGVPKYDRLVEQAIEFPKGRYGHDDYPDTCALLFQQLTKEIVNIRVPVPNKHQMLAMMKSAEDYEKQQMFDALTSDREAEDNQRADWGVVGME
jgi:hypothetical protein